MIWLACKLLSSYSGPLPRPVRRSWSLNNYSYLALYLREQGCTFTVLSPLAAAFFPPPALILCIFENRFSPDRSLVQPDL